MRYEFGKNWSDFITSNFDESKAETAYQHMLSLLGKTSLENLSFIDVGCGSGIHSLAAIRAGAKSVTSFDFDQHSVEATSSLRTLAGAPSNWQVSQGSVLDSNFIDTLGKFDVVYSWGVLHHTGEMWNAISSASKLLDDNGIFYIALYATEVFVNPTPSYWMKVKKRYNQANRLGRFLMEWHYAIRFTIWPHIRANLNTIDLKSKYYLFKSIGPFIPKAFLNICGNITSVRKLQNLGDKLRRRFSDYAANYKTNRRLSNPFSQIINKDRVRGMDFWVDVRDWLGGYPMEFAGNMETKVFCQEQLSLNLINIKAGEACTEFVFYKEGKSRPPLPYTTPVLLKNPFLKVGEVGWKTKLPDEFLTSFKQDTSSKPTMVLESSIPIGWEVPHDGQMPIEIANDGNGRHTIIGEDLYFSTTDNSSPEKNGRDYSIAIIP